ncbi:ABC transporter ATP-binding protein [Gordonia terrae]|uniref:ABC transporter ATP-binding protein n=2 Tax=Gordonia terrae TaxID=2055 RepID=A0AAD0K4J9_9ACTN|nr:ABC transporter ATP-binding protein [Gordonia terrae]VTR09597.1 ABC transporter [Clostridioides difficile]ANY22208.1 ABC transporter ATP-binding protein [Gordonia terrae]AWO82949.1 ABC transporter ATP-binding protein [Gordonia terrae]VTS29720.1 LIV-I protein F [Gordonia terrae]GAB46324.1 putative ABC transporter ATP-binding protein [Gordonia terrae NBRC 100016]
MNLLECRDVTTGYVRTRPCVRGVDLVVDRGRITCLLGPNGAGKTTLLMSLAGMLPRFDGRMTVDGRDIRGGHPREAVRSGIVLVADDRALFRSLTVAQNLRLAVRERSRRRIAIDEIINYFPDLEKRLHTAAGRLSGGEQQMLAIGRALLQKPKVLLIDELSMGLAPVIVDQILAVLQRLAGEEDLAVLLVEQHVHLALGIADHAVVLVHGELVLTEDASVLRADPSRIEKAYLGVDVATPQA